MKPFKWAQWGSFEGGSFINALNLMIYNDKLSGVLPTTSIVHCHCQIWFYELMRRFNVELI